MNFEKIFKHLKFDFNLSTLLNLINIIIFICLYFINFYNF